MGIRPPVYITDLVIDLLAGIQFMGSLPFPTLMFTKGGGHLFEGFRVNP